jgi:hypothetical protein
MAPDSRAPTAVAPLVRGWSDAERARLRVLADVLIPASDAMPGADDVGVADEHLDAVLAARPDLVDDLRRALADHRADAITALDDLRSAARGAYHALVLVVLAAYYRSPEVQLRIGYPGQEPRPVSAFTYPEYLTEGLLDHVLAAP